jgi:hypothetical protein
MSIQCRLKDPFIPPLCFPIFPLNLRMCNSSGSQPKVCQQASGESYYFLEVEKFYPKIACRIEVFIV